MAKERRPTHDYAVYLAVRFVVCLVQALPPSAARAVAAGLAWLAHRVDRRHREVARDNLRHAFPDASPARVDRLVRNVYDHFCTVVVEIIRVPRKLHPINWRRHIEMVGGDRIVECLTCGRPLLIVTG